MYICWCPCLSKARLSTHGHVYMSNVSHSAGGLFRCEVSGEAPDFLTVYAERELKVVSESILVKESFLLFDFLSRIPVFRRQ